VRFTLTVTYDIYLYKGYAEVPETNSQHAVAKRT
jgi:hypothetical protein